MGYEFAATIERAEKQIILAKHGRRLLSLLDDTPVVPGYTRTEYEYAGEARQVLNDVRTTSGTGARSHKHNSTRSPLAVLLLPSKRPRISHAEQMREHQQAKAKPEVQ